MNNDGLKRLTILRDWVIKIGHFRVRILLYKK